MRLEAPRTLRLGPLRVPVDERGDLALDFLGPSGTVPTFSAADVLKREVPAEEFRDRIVLVGVTDVRWHDRFPTPFDGMLPGVEIHATVIDDLLQGRSLRMQPAFGAGYCIELLIPALFFGLVVPRLRAVFAALLLPAVLAAFWTAAQLLFARRGVCLQVTGPTLAILLASLGALAHRIVSQERALAGKGRES
jgi:adenylate cyclase